jgi:hypothetical protein
MDSYKWLYVGDILTSGRFKSAYILRIYKQKYGKVRVVLDLSNGEIRSVMANQLIKELK